MIDLHPAADRLGGLLGAVADDQLGLPTPCPELCLGDLIDHVGTFAVRFAAAARKDVEGPMSAPPSPSRTNLEPGWRDRIARDLRALAEAWRDPQAWQGTTYAGSLELPAEVAGLVALDELVVHGWDVATATGQPYEASAQEAEAAMAFVSSFDAPRNGRPFGPIVAVADDAPPLDRLLGLTGRHPSWRAPA